MINVVSKSADMIPKKLLFLAILIISLCSSCIVMYEGAYTEASDVNYYPLPKSNVVTKHYIPPPPPPQVHCNPPPPKPHRPNVENDNKPPRIPTRKPTTSSSSVNKKPVRRR